MPSHIEELQQKIREAEESSTPILPIGGATFLDYGWPMPQGTRLDTKRLSQIEEYPSEELTITVGAGLSLTELAFITKEKKQMLPLDVPTSSDEERPTVGGLLATNTYGPRAHHYGTIRDYVIGVEFLGAHGEAIKAGGRVVKNVAGYDLMKLQIGALGTLGVITQVSLKLLPRPETALALWGELSLEQIESTLSWLSASPIKPAAVVIAGPALSLPGVGRGQHPRLLLLLEESEEAVDWQAREAKKQIALAQVEPYDAILSWGTNWPARVEADAVVQLSLPSSQIESYVKSRLSQNDAWLFSCGRIFLALRAPTLSSLQSLRQDAERRGGSLTALRLPGSLREQLPPFGVPKGLSLMKKIKQALDPQDIFNPGRLWRE